ncbi:MAG: hypothetical protein L3J19_06885 [Sulfurimonas sp.]|nr:hypothetical protein [Sulfurimonas sp.]
MKYTIDGTTKRYKGNKNCKYGSFIVNSSDKYQYGCEFEFYIDTEICDYEMAIDEICKEMHKLTSVDILVDIVSLPKVVDKNRCLQMKPDISLVDNGIEISVPIISEAGVEHFIKTISPIIDKYGYTNEETGFHIHISTIKKDGINFNFYKYMLLCHRAGLLSSWKPRVGYSQNVMDILSHNNKQKSREIKTKKSTIWNLEKIEPNHVEIKSIGGDSYHMNTDKMIKEFLHYSQCFDETLQKDTEADKQMYAEHEEQISKLPSEINSSFATALTEAGII